MQVSNLLNVRGNKVANQFVITDGSLSIFKSYDSFIAEVEGDKVTLDPHYWDYSATTIRHLKTFLNTTASTKVIRERVASGEYNTRNLNA